MVVWQRLVVLTGVFSVLSIQAAWAEQVPRIRDLQRPAITVTEWMAQVEAAAVQVTNVRVERTDTGLEITLETAVGKPLQVDATKFRSVGNSLIADIPNAVLALPNTQEFNADNPTGEIANVRVTQLDASRIRVSVTGNNALPKQEVTLKTGAFAYSLNPEAEEPDEEIVVTGEGQRGYRVPNTSVGTRTDTPLRDIPQSIQVVPQQVLEDQQVTNLNEALRNVAGVAQGSNSSTRGLFALPIIRGFNSSNDILTNGLREPFSNAVLGFNSATIERIEVLKGPASVLYGQGSTGGVVNLVTKKPLSDPFYSVEFSAGSFNFYRGAIDLTGPLNASKTVLYRLIGSAQTTESFINFFDRQDYVVAPALTWQISDRTKLTLAAEYVDRPQTNGQVGLPAVGTELPNPNGRLPRDCSLTEPFARDDTHAFKIGYDFEHRFSENWQLRSALRATWFTRDNEVVFPLGLNPDNRTLRRVLFDGLLEDNYLNFDNYAVGDFATGSIQHQLVVGFNYTRRELLQNVISRSAIPLDIFNPIFNQPLGASEPDTDSSSVNNAYGIYIQDQITLAENLKLLVGGRFDITTQRDEDFLSGDGLSQQQEAFSPRVGIVYQPIQPISFYASYSRSFTPVTGVASDGSAFQPERGTQYEVGIKADISSRLSATLAFYDLTRSNVSTADPNNPLFSIQTGEQRSRGIEFDLSGEILPGWNIIAGYALTDTEITKDNTFAVGNQFANVPRHSFSLWTTYEFQTGGLKGFGIGAGVFYTGERQGDLANTFEFPSFLRTDAAIFYKRDRFRAAINFKNLFDVDYFESANGRNNVFPGDPFTVQGTILWQF